MSQDAGQDTVHAVVAPRPEAGAALPSNWQDEIKAIPGVTPMGGYGSRLQIRATQAALDQARSRFGALLHIEPVVSRGFP
jgi:hypothetical protein